MNSNLNVKNKYNFLFFITLWILYILSNSIFILFKTTSLRTGLVIGILFFIYSLFIANKTQFITIDKKYLLIILIVCSSLFIQVIVSMLFFGNECFERSVYSIILLAFVLISATFFINLVDSTDNKFFNKVIFATYIFMTLLGIISIIMQRFNIVGGKNMIIFVEPSHFALVYLPLVLYMTYNVSNKKKLLFLIVSTLIALMVENLTLLVGITFIFVVTYWKYKYKFLLLLSIFALIILKIGKDEFQYYLDRLNISIYSDNLSVLVWVSGWERAFLSFKDGFGIGLGFQRLGYVGKLGYALERIYSILGGRYLNLNDGASLAPKIIAEIGAIGVVLLLIYLKYFFKILKEFLKGQIKNQKDIFFCSVFLLFSIQLFIRGVGYFSPASFMFYASIYWVTIYKTFKFRNIIN